MANDTHIVPVMVGDPETWGRLGLPLQYRALAAE